MQFGGLLLAFLGNGRSRCLFSRFGGLDGSYIVLGAFRGFPTTYTHNYMCMDMGRCWVVDLFLEDTLMNRAVEGMECYAILAFKLLRVKKSGRRMCVS